MIENMFGNRSHIICKYCIEQNKKSSVILKDEYKRFRVIPDSWDEDGEFIENHPVYEKIRKYSCSKGHSWEKNIPCSPFYLGFD